jgi:hypothetical protein
VRVALAVEAHDGIGVTAVLIPPVVASALHHHGQDRRYRGVGRIRPTRALCAPAHVSRPLLRSYSAEQIPRPVSRHDRIPSQQHDSWPQCTRRRGSCMLPCPHHNHRPVQSVRAVRIMRGCRTYRHDACTVQ